MQVDLNLLRALDALVEHESVQGAAAALHLTPPAMSHTLRRLRAATGDDVLVRNGRAMVPTPRAIQLREEVRELLTRAEGLLSPPPSLDLSALDRTFTIRANEALMIALAPPLLAEVTRTARGVTIVFLGETPTDGHELARGTVDLEVGNAGAASPAIHSRTIAVGDLEVVMRRGHPLATSATVTISDLAAATHVVVSRRGRLHGPVDVALESLGLTRRVIASMPSTASALEIIRQSDAVGVMAGRLVADESFVTRPVPIDLPPPSAVVTWHRRNDSDPAHEWLRSLVTALLEEALS